jgi:hypothetical protein
MRCSLQDMSVFDGRENGYRRVLIPLQFVELLSWQLLPPEAKVYVYVPYSMSVVEKYGADPATGLPVCSGPHAPPGILPEEVSVHQHVHMRECMIMHICQRARLKCCPILVLWTE